ncbi:head GIN domain-containing protein [Chloroflexota bacterium]
MKQIGLVLIIVLIIGAVGCNTFTITGSGGSAITGSGNLATQEMDYSDFTRIDVSNAFRVTITESDSFLVSITLDDNIFEYLDMKQAGDTLYIGLAPNNSYRNTTLRATVNMPELNVVELSGASRGDVNGFSSSDSLTLGASGASSFRIDDMDAGDTKLKISGASKVSGSIYMADGVFDISGASTVELEGSAYDVSMNVSGAGSAKLANFVIANADIELSGASDAKVNVSGRLDIDASGASKLSYSGNPTLGRVSISGFSSLSQD